MASYGTFPPNKDDKQSSQHDPVPRVPAPWKLKAESYVLCMKLKELPRGVYDPLEASWADEELGVFKGGLGTVIIVRYSDTPVGKFDKVWERSW